MVEIVQYNYGRNCSIVRTHLIPDSLDSRYQSMNIFETGSLTGTAASCWPDTSASFAATDSAVDSTTASDLTVA